MSAIIINGKEESKKIYTEISGKISILRDRYRTIPGLAIVMIGSNPASEIYVRNKIQMAAKLGINAYNIRIPEDQPERTLLKRIDHLNHDPKIHGIILQLPMPSAFNSIELISHLNPQKDVDGLTPTNLGNLTLGVPALYPCTPQGCLDLIKSVDPNISGKIACVFGRSVIVGKPLAQLLLAHNASVIHLHSKSENIDELLKTADIIVVAVGKSKFLKAKQVKSGAIIIDVGINRGEKGNLEGDVDFESVSKIAKAITPVPGGVGPMTIAHLMKNTVLASCKQKNIDYQTMELHRENRYIR